MWQLRSSTIWHWLTFSAIGLTVLNPSSFHVPFFTLSWTGQVSPDSETLSISPPLPFIIYLPWPNWSPISFMRAPWWFYHTLMDPFTEFILARSCPTPSNINVLSIYKVNEQLWILSCSKSQPEPLSLGFSCLYRDVSSMSCSSDFEAPFHSGYGYIVTVETKTNKKKITAWRPFSSNLVIFVLITLGAKKTCHLFFKNPSVVLSGVEPAVLNDGGV